MKHIGIRAKIRAKQVGKWIKLDLRPDAFPMYRGATTEAQHVRLGAKTIEIQANLYPGVQGTLNLATSENAGKSRHFIFQIVTQPDQSYRSRVEKWYYTNEMGDECQINWPDEMRNVWPTINAVEIIAL